MAAEFLVIMRRGRRLLNGYSAGGYAVAKGWTFCSGIVHAVPNVGLLGGEIYDGMKRASRKFVSKKVGFLLQKAL